MPDKVLLDTSIVSVFLKTSEKHESARRSIQAQLTGKIAFISFVTVAEMLYWAEKNNWGESRRAQLDQRLRVYGILDPTRTTAEIWAKSRRACEQKANTKQPHDLWIASAAIEHELTLYTRDGDFTDIPGLNVINIPQVTSSP